MSPCRQSVESLSREQQRQLEVAYLDALFAIPALRGACRRGQADNVEGLLVDRQLLCPMSLLELVRRRLPNMRQRRLTIGVIVEQAPLFLLH